MGSSPSTEHPTALLPSLPSGRGAQQVPGARGPQAGPAREHSLAPGDAAQRQGHMAAAALLPSAIPTGPGAELTGGPGSPRGAAPSTSPGRPCRDRGQLLWDGPRGAQSFPAPCRGCTALGHPRDLQEGRGARETWSHSPFPLGHPSPPARIKKKASKGRSGLFPCPLQTEGDHARQSPSSVVSGRMHAMCLSPRCPAPATARARVCVRGQSWWGAQPMSGTKRSTQESSFKLVAVPPSVCPHMPPAVPMQHQGGCTFTDCPGGPGGPTGPSGPGGPGSPKGPRGPGLPGGPGLP